MREPVAGFGQLDDRSALRSLVSQARRKHRLGQLRPRYAPGGDEFSGPPVAVGNGAGLVEQQRRAVAGGLNCPARRRKDVPLHHPVHPGDADRRQQAADRRGREADEQRDEHDGGLDRFGVNRHWLERYYRDQKDHREPGDQDVERNLVGRLLPASALDEGNHPVQERLTRIRCRAGHDPVRQDHGAARHRRPVAARFADHRG